MFALVMVIFVIYFGIIRELGFKVNGDLYTILSTVSACKNYISGNFDANLFPDALLSSPHTNILSWGIAILATLFDFEPIKAFYLLGPLGVLVFVFSFDYFLSGLAIKANRRALVIIGTVLLVPATVSFNYVGDGIFTLIDIFVTSFGWRIIGFSLFFLCLAQSLNSERKLSFSGLFLLMLTSFALSNIHLLNYLMYLILLFGYTIAKLLTDRTLKKELVAVWCFALAGGAINLIFWPFYSLIPLLNQSLADFRTSPMTQDPGSYAVNSLKYHLNLLSFAVLGLIYLVGEKNKFVKFTSITCLVIILGSLFIPFLRFPFFWRFVSLLKILLIIAVVDYISIKITSYTTAIAFSLFITLCFVYTGKTIEIVAKRTDSQFALYQELKKLDLRKGTILSDERTANVIQAIPFYKVYAIPSGHIASRTVAKDNLAKMEVLGEVLKTYDYQKINRFLVNQKIAYVVINKEARFVETCKILIANDFSFYPKAIQTSDLTVFVITAI